MMVGRKAKKREAGSGDAPPLTSATAMSIMAADNPTSNVKFRILNTNLKFAISNCRNLLEVEIRKTNNAMREKIQEWISRDATNVTFNSAYSKDFPLAQENERMRQILSDLVNGPLASLLPTDERKKLVKLVIPILATANNPFNEEHKEVDFFQAYDSQTSLYADIPAETDMSGMSFEDLVNTDEEVGEELAINYSSSNETVVSAAQLRAEHMKTQLENSSETEEKVSSSKAFN